METLKKLSRASIGRALERAELCRVRNEPLEAESICRDVLAVEPENHAARVQLVLSLTDQLEHDMSRLGEAMSVVGGLENEYERFYYSGVVEERAGKAHLTRNTPGTGAYRALWSAMQWYEKAEAIRPPDNEEAVLRWNACTRLLLRLGHLQPVEENRGEPLMLE
jgi:hypothetical protein